MTVAQRGVAFGLLALIVVWAEAPACQIVGGYQSFSPHPCNVLLPSKLDERNIATQVLVKQTDGSCYWIDQTEVTVGQYAQFLNQFAQDGQAPPWDMQRCAWKGAPSDPANDASECATEARNLESSPFDPNMPIRCIDWCDAEAFCAWAGTEDALCGSNANPEGVFEPSNTQDYWGDACSVNGAFYPNGASPVLDQCNVGLAEAGQCVSILDMNNCGPTYVDSFPGCVSQASSALNMVGNVAEWVVLCDSHSDGGPDTPCQHRGGSFADSLESATCTTVETSARNTRDRTLGLRCCGTLTPTEHNQVAK
jgi:sulfatase modifying factor 1